ncbi:MAG TPA: glycosyltransferase family 39 protein, partial [Polyangiaceae bacterium]|nr:glycosyltransferase family 39 protein [Polyangiaceae bacterium]
PVNWLFPVSFYELAGQKVWGVRLWLVILKLLSVWICYLCVSKVSGRTYGLAAALGLTLLLGQRWQALQTAYAFLTAVPLVLAAWHFLISEPLAKRWHNALAAGAFTTLAIWTKINTGLYVLAGGCLVILFWSRAASIGSSIDAGGIRTKVVRFAAALAVGSILCAYVSVHYESLYLAYLVVPLLLALGWSLFGAGDPGAAEMRRRLELLGIYAGGTVGLSVLILVGYYGASGAVQYGRELFGILTTIKYQRAFPELGEPILYVGLNEYYWLQLPWLLTVLFSVWLLLQRRWGAQTFGSEWPERRRQVSAAFLLATLHGFVLYPRSDDMHLFQALLVTVPALFVILSQIDAFVKQWRPRLGVHFREGVLLLCALYASTIFVQPKLDVFEFRPGDYANSRLEYLDYRKNFEEHLRRSRARLSDREWDVMLDSTARYVDAIAEENEAILVLSDQRVLHVASGTTSVGGRYAFFFYLVSTGLLDRAGFDKIVPPEVLHEILENPPRVIVCFDERGPMMRAFPELRRLRDERYAHTRFFRHMRVYELKAGQMPFMATRASRDGFSSGLDDPPSGSVVMTFGRDVN